MNWEERFKALALELKQLQEGLEESETLCASCQDTLVDMLDRIRMKHILTQPVEAP